MFSFKGYQTKAKNKHLEHLEDQIIDNGSKGGQNAVNFLVAIRNMLAGKSSKKVNMTVKWDGTPSLICGINPENGRFFVGTKSIFNKTPKINYTVSDIRKNHGTGQLGDKLIVCLQNLKRIVTNGIYQGDFLFRKVDLKTTDIDGESMITFTPNTITYAMPVNSNIGRKIASAKMGIVFHTKYTGKTMQDLRAGFGTVTGGGGRNVFLASAGYKDTSGMSKFTSSELTKFDSLIRMAQGSLSKAGPMLDQMNSTDSTSVGFRLKTFFNSVIRNSTGGMGKVKTLQGQFRDYYENFINAEIAARKSVSGKQQFIKAKKDNLKFIDKNQSALYMAIASHVSLASAKDFLISKLNQVQSIGHFLKTSNGYRVTAPEGFVAVDRSAGAVKLVDRLEFSRANFTMDKDWG